MSAGRKISNAEAGLIISGWRDSGVVIKSQCEIEPVAFSFRGRIVEFSGLNLFAAKNLLERVSD